MCKTIYYSSRLWMCLYSKTLTYFLLLMISHKNVTTQECSRIVLPINLSLHFLCQIFLATVILFCHNCVFVEWLRCGLNQDRADYHGTYHCTSTSLRKVLHCFTNFFEFEQMDLALCPYSWALWWGRYHFLLLLFFLFIRIFIWVVHKTPQSRLQRRQEKR